MKRKLKLKLKYKKIGINLAIIILLVIFIISIYPVGEKIYYEKKSEEVQEMIIDKVIQVEENEKEKKQIIDFEKLKNLNSDVVGWIEIPNTNINYAIMKAKDNAYYLSHDVLKKYNIYGSIFMNYQNNSDFSDNNTILFGHNTYKDTLFGELIKIYEGKIGNDIKIFIYTENEKIEYSIYAAYITTEDDELPLNTHTIFFERNESTFQKKEYPTKTLTLSTCYQDDSKRVIIHAQRLND